ncbi:hypothetical protein [Collimonas humicola]|uniref:hypothetical protein n=1 Tax=Collimonas humicola TaxID=2825886 RepID=UPI001B8C5174|nr:hypothetical protein [Collimonas humicola]
MKIMMYLCLNSLLIFALVGIAELVEPAFIRLNFRRHTALAFCAALVIVICLVVGLLLGAFHE